MCGLENISFKTPNCFRKAVTILPTPSSSMLKASHSQKASPNQWELYSIWCEILSPAEQRGHFCALLVTSFDYLGFPTAELLKIWKHRKRIQENGLVGRNNPWFGVIILSKRSNCNF
jgi:hypothetical protein